jgi:hypothetical protein
MTLPFFQAHFFVVGKVSCFFQFCGAESRAGAGVGAEIKNCGSGAAPSFLFITEMVPEEVFANYYNFDPNSQVKKDNFQWIL